MGDNIDGKAVIGPVLPFHLMKTKEDEILKSEENAVVGPALPPHFLREAQKEDEFVEEKKDSIGPQLPPHLLKTKSEESLSIQNENNLREENKTKESSSIGPALPPHLQKTSILEGDDNPSKELEEIATCFGPQIPQHLRQKLQEESPIEESKEEDEDVYGPLPPTKVNYSKSQMALEERALQLKMDQLDPQQSKSTVREEWMLELPAVKAANLGLGPRQFRSKAGPDFSDRSSWTDTPNKKKAKKEVEVDLKKEAEMKEIRKRDEEQEKISKKHKKKNKESLLELHQNEMKKKKKDEGEQGERRPFSREIDLQVNRFDEAQKKAILKKAQLLDDRFSSGQSKFL